MTPLSRTPEESTVLLLQLAAHSGSPVLIPGAWDIRPLRPASRSIGDETQATLTAQTVVVPDRGRLEREREGGGAPSERGHRASFLVRLWRTTRA